MTSHYRHRRFFNPATAFPMVEPGEITVNTANRQLGVGNADPGSPGVIKPLLAVRIFDVAAQYAVGDLIWHVGPTSTILRALVPVSPGPFNAAQWEGIGVDQNYIDTIINDMQADIAGKVNRSGDTMDGRLLLAFWPVDDDEATPKSYVDTVVAQGGPLQLHANQIIFTPEGTIIATDVQAAITELDTEKASLNSPNFVGNPTAPTSPPGDSDTSIATTAFVQNAVGAGIAAIDLSPYAPKNSPVFTGEPQAPTPLVSDNDNSIATTAFVQAVVGANIQVSANHASVAEFRSNSAPSKIIDVGTMWGATAPVLLAANQTPDLSQALDFYSVTAGTSIPNPINVKGGQKGVIWLIGATVAAWGSSYKFPNGIKPTSTGGWDLVTFIVWDAANVLCTFTGNHA
jgi:hypothetical protein